MKKLSFVFLGIFLLILPLQAFADGTSGCGLGSQFWSGSKGLFAHLMAYSTNGSTYTGMFGMTSGTSNCDVNKAVQLDRQQEVFVAQNHEALSDDMSMGQGEFLVAYSHLLGCNTAAYTTFSRVAQDNFNAIFVNATVAQDVLSNTKDIITRIPELSQGCTAL